jgi:hypothetical protein
MTQNYTYIIYNSDYGGYSMNRDFLVELFKRHPVHTDIGKKIFQFEKIEENLLDKLDNLETEYFLNYRITNDRIYDIINNESYYLSEHCTEFRSNPYVIDYIFERTVLKILNLNEFTPYFYRVLFQLDRDKFSTRIDDYIELIELENVTQESIHNYNLEIIYNRARRRRILIINNIPNTYLTNIKFYKNGFKLINENEYYKFNFDININENNLYDILSKIDNGSLLDFILFDDINGSHSSLILDRIKKEYIWKVSEYDGSESIKLSLPYEDIINDLLNHIWKTEDYITKTNLSQYLINKEKTLKDLTHNMYEN